MKQGWIKSGIIAAALLGVACTSTKNEAELAEESRSRQANGIEETLDALRAETELGRNMAGRLVAYYGTVDQPDINKYVNTLAAYLGKYSDAPERKYMVAILDTEIINAFAAPGGYLLISKGAFQHAKNEAELAGVIGHEIAHVAHRHMVEKLKNMKVEEIEEANQKLANKVTLEKHIESRIRPKPTESEVATGLIKFVSSGSGGLSFVKMAGAGLSVIMESGLASEKEFEADSSALVYAQGAGYRYSAYEQYLCRIEFPTQGNQDCVVKGEPKKQESILNKTHPSITKRTQSLKELAQMAGPRDNGKTLEKRFMLHKRKI